MSTGGNRIVTGRFVLAAASCFFMTVVFFAHFSSIPSYSITVLGTDATVAGFVAGIFIVGDIAGRLLLGGCVWRFGPNRLCFLSMAGGTAVSALYLLTENVPALCAIGLVHGFTYGVAELAVFARVTADLSPSVRGKGLGFFTLSYSLASAVGPLLSIHLVNTGLFREIFLLGLASSAASAACALFLGKDAERGQIRKTQTSGYLPIVRKTLPISAVMLIFLVSYSGVLTFIAPYGIELGMETYTAVFFVVLSAATVVSRIGIMGKFDTVGPDPVLIPLMALYAAGMLLLGAAPFGEALLVSAFVIGLALAALGSAGNVMAVEGLDIRDQGMALAVVQVFIDLSYIIGPVAYGSASESLGYSGCYTAMAAVGLASLAVYLLFCSGLVRRRTDSVA